jgi:hypothetical protein
MQACPTKAERPPSRFAGAMFLKGFGQTLHFVPSVEFHLPNTIWKRIREQKVPYFSIENLVFRLVTNVHEF